MTEAAPTLPSTASQEWCKVFAELPDVQEKVNWLQSRITKTWRENHPESPLKGPTQDEIGRCWQSIFESIFEPTTPKQHTPEFPPPARQTTRESIETFLNNEEPWNTFFPRKDKTPSTSPLSPEQGSQGSFGPILDFPLNNSAFLQFHGMQMNEDVHTVNRIHNGVNDSFEHLGTAVVIDPSKNIYAEATQPDAPYAFPSEHGLLDLLGSSIGTPSLTTTSVTDFAFPGATTPACQQSGYQQGGNSYEPGGNPVYMAGEGIYPSSAVNQEIFDQQLFPGNDTAAFQKQLTALDSVFTPLHQPSLTCYEEVVRFDHEVRPNETKTEERPRLEIKPFESVAMNRTTIRPPVHDTGLNQIPSPYVQPLDRPPTSQDNLTDSQQVGQSNGNRINDECCGITFTYAWKLMDHRRKHAREKEFFCEICAAPITYKRDLAPHQKSAKHRRNAQLWATSTQGIRGANAPARSSLESIPSNAPRGRGKGRGTTQLETPRTNLRPTKRATRTRQQGEPPSSLTSIGVEMRELNSAYDDASTGESFPNVDSAPVYSGTHFWGSASGT